MAEKEFKLPDVGEGVAEGELVQWLVEPGDTVSEDQPVAEVETDKALVEVPSPYDGTVKELHAEEGEMVPVGEIIVTYDVPEEGEAEAEPEAEAETEPGSEAEPEPAESEAAGEPEAATETANGEAEVETPEGRVFAPPSARRLARELGVDISAVEGTGPGGRVTDADVRAHAETETGTEAEAETAAESAAAEPETEARPGTGDGEVAPEPTGAAGRERTLAVPATRNLADQLGVDVDDVPTDETREGEPFVTAEMVQQYAEAQQAAQAAQAEAVSASREAEAGEAEAAAEAGAEAEAEAEGEAPEREISGERVPYRGVRRSIGEAMERSKFTAPHVTHFDDVDVTDLVDLREEYKEMAAERDVKLTYMPFIMKAVTAALKEHPYVNAMLDEEHEEIVLRDEYHLGVATETEVGLMVPVVENADEKSLLTLAEETREKADRARDRSITREELRGSTFSITNVGAIGGLYGTPIVNYPEVAILALGEIQDQPRVVDGEVVPRKVLTLSLSFDHRIIDGATAARFTNTIKEYLTTPKRLLLE